MEGEREEASNHFIIVYSDRRCFRSAVRKALSALPSATCVIRGEPRQTTRQGSAPTANCQQLQLHRPDAIYHQHQTTWAAIAVAEAQGCYGFRTLSRSKILNCNT